MRYIVYFDVETGGVEPHHPTIQLAAIAVDEGGAETSSFEQLIEFEEAACDPAALAMNHYDRDKWSLAVTPIVCARKFAAWLQPFQSVLMTSKRTGAPYTVAQLAGYNALTFDLSRVKALFGKSFFPCSYQVLDVLQRVHFWFVEHPDESRPENLKLSTVAAWLGIDTSGAHEALTDVRLCAEVWRRLRLR